MTAVSPPGNQPSCAIRARLIASRLPHPPFPSPSHSSILINCWFVQDSMVDLMLCQRWTRWHSIKPTMGKCQLFSYLVASAPKLPQSISVVNKGRKRVVARSLHMRPKCNAATKTRNYNIMTDWSLIRHNALYPFVILSWHSIIGSHACHNHLNSWEQLQYYIRNTAFAHRDWLYHWS